jgi:hypothetical protein
MAQKSDQFLYQKYYIFHKLIKNIVFAYYNVDIIL